MAKYLFFALFCFGLLLCAPASATVYSTEFIANGDFSEGLAGWDCYLAYDLSDENGQACPDSIIKQEDDIYYIDMSSSEYHYVVLMQDIIVPSDIGKLTGSFDYLFDTTNITGDSYFQFKLSNTDTDKELVSEVYNFQSGSLGTWTGYEKNLNAYAGQTLQVMYIIYNDSIQESTSALVKNISMFGKSYPSLRGVVKERNNETGQIKKIKGAKVRLRTPGNTLLWKGKTKKKGKFTAKNVRGYKKKARIIIRHKGEKKVFRRKIKWGVEYKYIFWI
ncbi:MAG: hypothetical protein ABH835_00580 [Patescibacteria group bacterium]